MLLVLNARELAVGVGRMIPSVCRQCQLAAALVLVLVRWGLGASAAGADAVAGASSFRASCRCRPSNPLRRIRPVQQNVVLVLPTGAAFLFALEKNPQNNPKNSPRFSSLFFSPFPTFAAACHH